MIRLREQPLKGELVDVKTIEIPNEELMDACDALYAVETPEGRDQFNAVVYVWNLAAVMHKALLAIESSMDYTQAIPTDFEDRLENIRKAATRLAGKCI